MVSVAQPALVYNYGSLALGLVTQPVMPKVDDFWIGFDIGMKDGNVTECTTHEQTNGYWFGRECKTQDATSLFRVGEPTSAALMTDAQIAAELEDYREDMLDREYHARGAW